MPLDAPVTKAHVNGYLAMTAGYGSLVSRPTRVAHTTSRRQSRMRPTQICLNCRIMFATHRSLRSLLSGARTGHINALGKFGTVRQNRHMIWRHINEPAVNRQILHLAVGHIYASMVLDKRTQKSCVTRQESNLATLQSASDHLACFTRKQNAFW
jgi:hypothetical protein